MRGRCEVERLTESSTGAETVRRRYEHENKVKIIGGKSIGGTQGQKLYGMAAGSVGGAEPPVTVRRQTVTGEYHSKKGARSVRERDQL